MIDGFTVTDRQGVQALDYNQRVHAAEGFGTIGGCEVAIGSGTLGASDTLDVAAGTIMHDGVRVDVPSQKASITAADGRFPRRDVVYVDGSGDVHVSTGDPETADPSQAEGVMAERPAPDAFADLAGTGVPIAEVWVSAGADVVRSEDVYRRAVPPVDGAMDLSDFDEIVASEHGYPGDRSGGDIMQLIRDHPDKVIVLDGDEYSVETTLDFDGTDARDLLAVRGRGASNARLVVENPDVDYFAQLDTWDAPNPFPRLSLKNLDLVINDAADYTDDEIDAGWGQWWIGERVDNANLRIVGRRSYGGDNPDGNKYGYHCCMANPDAVGVHREIKLPDGDSLFDGQSAKEAAIGFSVEADHEGTNLFVGCYVEEFWDNGFYVKDGTGRSILIGCEAYNCGNSHIRIGKHDQVIDCRAKYDFDHSTVNADGIAGALLDSDEAEGTAVLGFRAINRNNTSSVVRIRTAAESATFRDLYIENDTSQNAIQLSQASAASHGDVDDDTHHDGIVTIDGARVIDNGDGSVQSASIRTNRSNCRLRDVSTTLSTDSWRASVQVQKGSVRIDGCRFDARDAGGNPYEIEVGESGETYDVGVVSVTDSRLFGGFILRDGTTVEAIDVRGNDMRQVASSDLFYDLEPADVGAVCTFHGNIGHLGQTSYGEIATATISADSVSANSLEAANQISGASASITNQISGGSLDVGGGTIAGGSLDVGSGTISGGDVSADSASIANAISAASATVSGDDVVRGDADRKVFVSDTEPTEATANDIWFEPQ